MIGEIVNERYQVEELLKETPFVKTYRVKDTSLDKPLILRMMYFSPDDFAEIAEYENQLKVFQQLYHPQIPRFLDSFSFPNQTRPILCSVSQYIELTPLAQLLEEKGRFSEDEAIAYLIQLTRIIEYLHSLAPPFIHQALHPGNISIGEDNKLYLTGYTLVRKDAEGKLFPLEVSMDYTAPEQMKGIATLFSDLYAIGITGVEMVTGQKYNKIYRRDFQSQANISTDFVKILQKLVEKEPENRYTSASALKNDLLNLQRNVQKKLESLNIDAELDKKQMVIPIIGITLAVLAVLILVIRPFFRTTTTEGQSPSEHNQQATQISQHNQQATQTKPHNQETTQETTQGNSKSSKAPNLSVDKTEIPAGEFLTVRYANVPGNLRDWIAIGPANLAENEWDNQFFLEGQTTGEIKFQTPLRSGDYEVRLYHDWPRGEYEVKAKTPFRVTTTENSVKLSDPVTEVTLDIYQDLSYKDELPSLATSQTYLSKDEHPKEKLVAEPSYEGKDIQYGHFLMGNGEDPIISYALDGNKIYVDKNNNQDLSDDGEPVNGANLVDLNLTLQNPQGTPQKIPYRLWVFPSNMGGFRYYARCHYAGNIKIQDKDYAVVAYEADEPDAIYRNEGIYIDLNQNGEFESAEKFRHHDIFELEGQNFLLNLTNP